MSRGRLYEEVHLGLVKWPDAKPEDLVDPQNPHGGRREATRMASTVVPI